MKKKKKKAPQTQLFTSQWMDKGHLPLVGSPNPPRGRQASYVAPCCGESGWEP